MKKRKTSVNYEEKYLLSELKSTRNALAAAYSNFDYALDPYLIDSSIYELNARQKREEFVKVIKMRRRY